jgi:hypothetical protein
MSVGRYTAVKRWTMGTMSGLYSLKHITTPEFMYSRVWIGVRKNGRRRRVSGLFGSIFPKGEYHKNKKLNIEVEKNPKVSLKLLKRKIIKLIILITYQKMELNMIR